ncbi:MAG TPA: DUF4062 domain-containing protein [Pyrinomonadaceae bacterium]|nr:DUF4062 domain-containing protein [Pyrinomonadaceae bacterium]
MKTFLSSTYIDLIEHRKLAVEALERLGQEVGRMEVFGARPEEPSKACLSEIEACDVFVGIYAHRYGYIPPGSQISITEAEYDHAAEHKKPIFCFMVDEDYPWPPKMIEAQPGKSKLDDFKRRVGEALVRDTFTTPEVLAFKIASSIGRHLAQNQPPGGAIAQGSAPRNLEVLAGRAISQTMAMVFVDLMRLLYVTSCNLANHANARRYPEFIEIADQHFGDLRSRIATYSLALNTESHEQINQLELRLSWVLGRLKRKPDLSNSYEEYFEKMRLIGDGLNRFCIANAGEQYKNSYENAVAKIKSTLEGFRLNLNSLDDLFQLRLKAQTHLLEAARESDGARIFSISDDMDQNFAILYFVLDYILLTMRVAEE